MLPFSSFSSHVPLSGLHSPTSTCSTASSTCSWAASGRRGLNSNMLWLLPLPFASTDEHTMSKPNPSIPISSKIENYFCRIFQSPANPNANSTASGGAACCLLPTTHYMSNFRMWGRMQDSVQPNLHGGQIHIHVLPPQMRFNARHQLAWAEGLGHVIMQCCIPF